MKTVEGKVKLQTSLLESQGRWKPGRLGADKWVPEGGAKETLSQRYVLE